MADQHEMTQGPLTCHDLYCAVHGCQRPLSERDERCEGFHRLRAWPGVGGHWVVTGDPCAPGGELGVWVPDTKEATDGR